MYCNYRSPKNFQFLYKTPEICSISSRRYISPVRVPWFPRKMERFRNWAMNETARCLCRLVRKIPRTLPVPPENYKLRETNDASKNTRISCSTEKLQAYTWREGNESWAALHASDDAPIRSIHEGNNSGCVDVDKSSVPGILTRHKYDGCTSRSPNCTFDTERREKRAEWQMSRDRGDFDRSRLPTCKGTASHGRSTCLIFTACTSLKLHCLCLSRVCMSCHRDFCGTSTFFENVEIKRYEIDSQMKLIEKAKIYLS